MARYVVRKGRLRKDEPYDPGTLVYYDEGLFQAGRAWLKNLSLGLTLAYLSIVAIAILIAVATGDPDPELIFIFALSPQVGLMFSIYWGWRKVEYGVCLYEGGVDAPRPNGLRVDRVFVPLEEIGKVKIIWGNHTIRFRNSWIRRIWISKKLLDVKGLRILDKLLQGYKLKQTEVTPRLVLYSPGARPNDTIHQETPGYNEPPRQQM